MEQDSAGYARGMEHLVGVVQELSLARDLLTIMAIVRTAARKLASADGVTFVLRNAGRSYYADEDALAPLWKGKRFSLESCISGWAMRYREAVVIEDVSCDPRIPIDAYRHTFVKSLVMVPIRRLDPVGAIGNYWATKQRPPETAVRLLQALADSTATAMANVELLNNLEARVAERTAELESSRHELEAFASAASHDLRAPLRAIAGFSEALAEDHGDALGDGKRYLDRIRGAAVRMGMLIDDLLEFSQLAHADADRRACDLAAIAREIVDELRASDRCRNVAVVIPPALPVCADPRLVRIMLENLLSNAWKFTSKRDAAHIELGAGDGAFFVRDDGAGFDRVHIDKLFRPFRRLHTATEFHGTGVGLATVHRIVQRHGGRVWADAAVDQGATFFFTLEAAR